WAGARRAPDRRLVHQHHALDALEPPDRAVGAGGLLLAALERAPRRAVQHLLHQAALSRARDAGPGAPAPDREAHRDVLQVVARRALDHEVGPRRVARLGGPAVRLLAYAPRSLTRARHLELAAQVARGLALDGEQRVPARPGVEQPPALLARAGAQV